MLRLNSLWKISTQIKLSISLYKVLTVTPKHPGTTLPDLSLMFSYLEPSFKKNANSTLTTIYQMDYNKIENLHLNLQESREMNRIQKIELKQIQELISSSPLTSSHFLNKYSIPPDLQSNILASNNQAQTIQEKLIELETQPPRGKPIGPFQFHALSYNLYGLYSARINTPENASSEFTRMRMIFKYNIRKKIEYFALLPFHEYNLFNTILSGAYNLEEAYIFFQKYNKYCFNQAIKVEDKYKYLLKKCYKLNFSERIKDYVIDQRELFFNLMKPMSSGK